MGVESGWPDIQVCKVRIDCIGKDGYEPKYFGLFLELKAPDVTIWLQNGKLTANKHIRQQKAVMDRLEAAGYCCKFACGFEEAKEIIDWYLT